MKVCQMGLMVMMSLGKAAAAVAFAFSHHSTLSWNMSSLKLKQQHILRQLQEKHTLLTSYEWVPLDLISQRYSTDDIEKSSRLETLK